MAVSTYVRFTGGPTPPSSPAESQNPGTEIVAHLVQELPRLGVVVRKVDDVEYAHELSCLVAETAYVVTVAYDWVEQGWWEVFYRRTVPWIRRVFGGSDDDRMRALTLALSAALASLPRIGEVRWYTTLPKGRSQDFTRSPET